MSILSILKKDNPLARFPRLDTVLMVEKIIYDTSGTYTKKQLWDRLPKKVMYQTYSLIIDYLLQSHKIGADRNGTLCWIWNPKMAEQYLKRTDLAR